MLELIQIDQYYGESHTLRQVDLEVTPGQCTCIMGRNGVGKTTLLKAMMGQVAIRSGDILFNGNAITHDKPYRRSALGIGYVPQGRQIFPLLTVEEHLKLAFEAQATRRRAMPSWVLDLFPLLKDMKSRLGGDLSGGQQQQLAIARALITEPKLLLLDEPTEGIQPNIVSDIGHIIRQLINEHHMTVLLVEQKLQFIRQVADRFYIVDRGSNCVEGDIDTLNETMIKTYLTV